MNSLDIELEQHAYEPGDTLRGLIRWSCTLPEMGECQVSMRIGWKTSGTGTEDLEVVDVWREDIMSDQGQLQINHTLPDFPFSFSGKLITLSWFLDAHIDAVDLHCQENICIAPQAKEVVIRATSRR